MNQKPGSSDLLQAHDQIPAGRIRGGSEWGGEEPCRERRAARDRAHTLARGRGHPAGIGAYPLPRPEHGGRLGPVRSDSVSQAAGSTPRSARRCPSPGPAAVLKSFCRGRRRLHSPAARPPGTANPATARRCPASRRPRPRGRPLFPSVPGAARGAGPEPRGHAP